MKLAQAQAAFAVVENFSASLSEALAAAGHPQKVLGGLIYGCKATVDGLEVVLFGNPSANALAACVGLLKLAESGAKLDAEERAGSRTLSLLVDGQPLKGRQLVELGESADLELGGKTKAQTVASKPRRAPATRSPLQRFLVPYFGLQVKAKNEELRAAGKPALVKGEKAWLAFREELWAGFLKAEGYAATPYGQPLPVVGASLPNEGEAIKPTPAETPKAVPARGKGGKPGNKPAAK